MSDNVQPLFGGVVPGMGTPNEGCIDVLEGLLERARAGELVGVVCAATHSDNMASYVLAGMIGPYSLLGALELAKADLIENMMDMG
jgi:hypothetical protein